MRDRLERTVSGYRIRRRDRSAMRVAKNMPLCWLNANRVIINMQNERKDIDRWIHIYCNNNNAR